MGINALPRGCEVNIFSRFIFVNTCSKMLITPLIIHIDGAHIFYGGYFFHIDNGNKVLGPRSMKKSNKDHNN